MLRHKAASPHSCIYREMNLESLAMLGGEMIEMLGLGDRGNAWGPFAGDNFLTLLGPSCPK